MSQAAANLDEDTFFPFVGEPSPSLVFVSLHPLHPFNDSLIDQLAREAEQAVRFGSLMLLDLPLGRSAILPHLAQARARYLHAKPTVMPGYYLFREGQLLAYDSGLPTRADMPAAVPSIAVAAIWYGFNGDKTRLVKSVLAAANGAVAPRIAQRMAEALSGDAAPPRDARAETCQPRRDELRWAYDTLGVTEVTPDEEVNAAWRSLRAANHPDRSAYDPDEFMRRTRLSKELNRARDVIVGHRARARAA